MAESVPSVEEMRAQAHRQGVFPTDDDLERARSFLAVLLPALDELERLVPRATVPAGMYLPLDAQ